MSPRPSPASGFAIGDRWIEPALCRISGPSGAVHVEPRAMDVLKALVERAGETVSRDELIQQVWKHPHVTDEALSRCVSLLRQALADDREHPRFLETIPKRGYRFIARVNGVAHPLPGDRTSLAVLPLLNLSGDPADDHVVDGITELLITNLACLPSLRVISRTSSMHYKGTHARLTEIARELDVERIVEGSVLHSDGRLQVVIQLIDPATDTHLFTRSYTRQLADVLRLQNEIAWTIAEEIGASVQPAQRDHLPNAKPVGEEAMLAYLRARHFWAHRTPDAFPKAIREYEACIAAEPEFAAAYSGLANTLVITALYGIAPPAALYARAKELGARAAMLDGERAHTLTTNGSIKLFFEWDLAAAERMLRQAVAANANYEVARLVLGDLLVARHQFDEALRQIHAAVRVSPFDLGLQMNYGQFLLYADRREEAAAQLQQTLDIGPHFGPARCLLAETFALMGDADAAKRELARAGEDIPVASIHKPSVVVHALLGESDRARELLARVEGSQANRYVPAFELARCYAALGDADAAFQWIDAGIEERAPMMLFIDTFPGFHRIRGDPRFAERIARIGLPRF